MSRSAVYCVLIRDGEQRWFAEVWGNLRRELVWGPAEFELWLAAGEEIDWEPEDVSGAAIVDFDTNTLTWGEQEPLTLPKIRSLYRRLLENSWRGFAIHEIPPGELHKRLYALQGEHFEEDPEESWEDRPGTVSEAAQYFYPEPDDDEEDDEYEDDLDPPFSEHRPGAWISIIDENGKLRQRGLSSVSADLLTGDESAIDQLLELEPVELPPEQYVTEGLWFDQGKRTIQLWGTMEESLIDRLRAGWPQWDVQLATDGYSGQCLISGLPGKPLSDPQALGILLPQLLSNQRFTMGNLLGAMGGSLKKTAIKATGCLTIVLSVPILLVGAFMSKWKEAGYAIGTLVVIVIVLFKFFEYRLKAKFQSSMFGARDEELEQQRPPVAGPQDESTRKKRVGDMLVNCGLPTLTEVEPHFVDFEGLA